MKKIIYVKAIISLFLLLCSFCVFSITLTTRHFKNREKEITRKYKKYVRQ